MRIEFDPAKNALNLHKHGIALTEGDGAAEGAQKV
jgi:uncharacterized DUF497 family protein